MWSVVDTQRNIKYYINFTSSHGNKISIGRSAESDLSFPNDKSVSRNHGEIILETITVPNTTTNATATTNTAPITIQQLSIIDLGSKFGITIIHKNKDQRIPINHKIVIENGAKIRLGSLNSFIEFHHEKLSLCLTRLSKPEKTHMKAVAKIIHAKIVNHVPDATFVVSNNPTATVKMITGN